MIDRELLEAAAKAAGLSDQIAWNIHGDGPYFFGDGKRPAPRYWAPLTDDGDALRLAVKLNLNTEYVSEPDGPEVWVSDNWSDNVVVMTEPLGKDPYAATRRAIVRAAASIGEATK